MLVIFAGGMLCNGLLGEPILAPLKNTSQVTVATVTWSVVRYQSSLKFISFYLILRMILTCRYIIFYTPFDIGYKIVKFLPIKIICAAMKEVYRYVIVIRVSFEYI